MTNCQTHYLQAAFVVFLGCPFSGNIFRVCSVIEGMRKQLVLGKMEFHRGIRIDSIPVEGFPGLLFVLATVFMFLGAIPATREFLLISGGAGIIGAAVLYYWHNQTRW